MPVSATAFDRVQNFSESDIAKTEIKNQRIKSLEMICNYCDLIQTGKELANEINRIKNTKDKNTSLEYKKLNNLESLYNLKIKQIREIQLTYRDSLGYYINSSCCKNSKLFASQLEKLINK